MLNVGERIKKLRRALDLTQQEFAERIGIKRNTIATYEIGRSEPINAVISLVCREFNVSETWLRTGEGEMFIPSPDGALEALAREYELSPGMYILIKRLLALKPENQQAAVDFAVKIAEDLNGITAEQPGMPPSGQERTVADAGKDIDVPAPVPDLAAKVAELEQQNQEKDRQLQELAAEIKAIKEEDALYGLTGISEASPTESVLNLNLNAKK